MRLATWNINGIRARIDYVIAWLEKRDPDIVGFQELKAEDDKVPIEAFQELGYEVHTHGQKSWNGVAIISKANVTVSQVGLPNQADAGARLLSASHEDMSFTTVYCPNGKDVDHRDYEMKLAWFEALSDYWQSIRDTTKQAIICGDFNIVPAAMDTHLGEDGDGKIFHTERERQQLATLMSAGLTDLFREKRPDADEYSWWDYRAGGFQRNLGLRIDLILGTQAILERTTEVVIDRDFRKKVDGLTASDHAPVYVDLA